MANYNLTKIISKKFMKTNEDISTEEKRVVEYYLNQDFGKIIGNHVVSADDCELMTTTQDGFDSISIDTPFYDNIHVKIGSANQSSIICGYSGDKVVFSIVDKDGNITNEVEYVNENNVTIQESLGVVLEESPIGEKVSVDAKEFSLSRKENGEEVYEGSLTPMLARAGSEEYFEFRTSKDEEDKNPSFIEKIIDSINSNAIVSVGTDNNIHKLIDYIDEIFKALDKKLQKTVDKKYVKKRTKKRVLDKKND